MPTPGPEDAEALAQVVKVLFAALGGTAGFLAAGPVGAGVAVGAAQGASAAVDTVMERVRRRQFAGAERAVILGARRAGLSASGLADALTRDPKVMLVAATALNAAAETAIDEKVKLMGRVLTNAATDTALIDEELLVARAMRVLEAPHVRILALLDEPERYEADTKGSSTVRWTPAFLAARVGWPRRSVTSVLLTLQSVAAALLTSTTIDGGTAAAFRELLRERKPLELDEMACEITDFGAFLVERLKESDSEEDEPGSRS